MRAKRGFSFSGIGGVLVLLVTLAFMVGWVWNLIKFIGLIGGDINTWFIARGVGIFLAPFGALLGYF